MPSYLYSLKLTILIHNPPRHNKKLQRKNKNRGILYFSLHFLQHQQSKIPNPLRMKIIKNKDGTNEITI